MKQMQRPAAGTTRRQILVLVSVPALVLLFVLTFAALKSGTDIRSRAYEARPLTKDLYGKFKTISPTTPAKGCYASSSVCYMPDGKKGTTWCTYNSKTRQPVWSACSIPGSCTEGTTKSCTYNGASSTQRCIYDQKTQQYAYTPCKPAGGCRVGATATCYQTSGQAGTTTCKLINGKAQWAGDCTITPGKGNRDTCTTGGSVTCDTTGKCPLPPVNGMTGSDIMQLKQYCEYNPATQRFEMTSCKCPYVSEL